MLLHNEVVSWSIKFSKCAPIDWLGGTFKRLQEIIRYAFRLRLSWGVNTWWQPTDFNKWSTIWAAKWLPLSPASAFGVPSQTPNLAKCSNCEIWGRRPNEINRWLSWVRIIHYQKVIFTEEKSAAVRLNKLLGLTRCKPRSSSEGPGASFVCTLVAMFAHLL